MIIGNFFLTCKADTNLTEIFNQDKFIKYIILIALDEPYTKQTFTLILVYY